MPLYEYECEACGHRFELIQKFSDPPAEACTSCSGGPVRKLLSSPAFQFKGSGWYITDYARKGSSPGGESGSTSTSGRSDSDKPSAASKSETPTPSTSSDSSS